jgi:uncharacterized protein (PEP-CTERM system associated)
VSGGFSYDREPCDLVGNSAQGLTLDSKVASVYAQVTHRLAPNLFGNLNGQYQHNTYSGGAYNGEVEQFYTFGANLQYRFNNYFSSQIGYNYDRLDSGISTPASGGIGSRSFDRNRVYVGVTASY